MFIAFTIMISVGLLGTMIGVIMGGASKHDIETQQMQLISSILGCVFLFALIASGVYPKISIEGAVLWFALGCYFAVGVLAFLLNETMARAMERGPNGMVWAILQSGMVIPFLVGVYAHNVEAGAVRLIGMVILMAALILMSLKSEDKKKAVTGKSWLFLSFVAFILCGIQQAVNCEPSYSPAVQEGIPVVYRTTVVHIGTVICSLVERLWHGWGAFRTSVMKNSRLGWFWVYGIGLQVFQLSASLFLSYNGMDRMAKLGLGALSYPIMVVSCIAGFTLYSFVFLRERLSWQQVTGLLCCVGGITLLSM